MYNNLLAEAVFKSSALKSAHGKEVELFSIVQSAFLMEMPPVVFKKNGKPSEKSLRDRSLRLEQKHCRENRDNMGVLSNVQTVFNFDPLTNDIVVERDYFL